MNINPDLVAKSDPRAAGAIDATIAEIARNGFAIVESETYPGNAYKTSCKRCGHTLKINQHVWRLRHSLKCE